VDEPVALLSDRREPDLGDPVPQSGDADTGGEPGYDDPEDRYSEVASILAAGYLRLLLANEADAATSDVCATSGPKECPTSAHEGLEVPERKSVHVSRD
jgi:hypothetical protein